MLIILCSTSSCIRHRRLKEGTYVSYEVNENELFSEAKYELKKIDEDTFNASDSINVIKDGATSGKYQKYFSFNIYFFLKTNNEYVKFEVGHLDFKQNSTATYTAVLRYDPLSFSRLMIFDFYSNRIFWSEETEDPYVEMRIAFKVEQKEVVANK